MPISSACWCRAMAAIMLCTVAALSAVPARAEWREATTKHFIIYSEGSEDSIRKAATNLETYDYLLRLMMEVPQDTPDKLKVYLLRDLDAVQATIDAKGSGVAGYYLATPRSPIAVGIRTSDGISSSHVLFHEYAHHLMLQYFPAAYPSWYIEGFAQYYGTAKVREGNVIELGTPAVESGVFNYYRSWLPLEKLLTARTYKDLADNPYAVYSQGWLLVHYLQNNEARKGQLARYLAAINAGQDYRAAMDAAFGPGAKTLERELRAYGSKEKLPAFRITLPDPDLGSVAIRELGPAEDAFVRHEIALTRGILEREAGDFAEEVRERAAKFPSDPYALSMLAEAEYTAGNIAAASAAVSRWLALQPKAPRALMLKGNLAVDALAAAKSADRAAWAAAREPILAAQKLAPEDPLVLEAHYDSYLAQGVLPPAKAQNALFNAHELVPQDYELRYKVAIDFERRGMLEPAMEAIRPAALRLHQNEDPKEKAKAEKRRKRYREARSIETESARDVLARLEAKLAAQKR